MRCEAIGKMLEGCECVVNGWKYYKFRSEVPAQTDYHYGNIVFKDNPGLVPGCGVRFFLQLLQFGDDWFLVRCLLTLHSSGDKLRRIERLFICDGLLIAWRSLGSL